jgi:nitrite reductase/ring-hydroxylating ferredoxin subunit
MGPILRYSLEGAPLTRSLCESQMTNDPARILVVAVLVAYVGWLISGVVGSGGWVDVGSASDIASAKVTYVPRQHIFVVSDGGRLVAYSAVSPHQGNLGKKGFGSTVERILYCDTNETFVEQLHGSSWDSRGRYVDGPAPRGLTTVALRIHEGRVEVAPSRWSPGPGRDVRGRPGLGPFCMGDVIREAAPGFARRELLSQQ